MELTPLKIRGKGGPRKKTFRPPVAKKPKTAEDDSPTLHQSLRKKRQRRRTAASIERLPVEILQAIMLHSENLNFARSSLRIGYHLSHKSFLIEVVLTAFAPTWDVWFGIPALGSQSKVHSYHGYQSDFARFGGDADFQNAVLACSWAKLPMILDAMQLWYRRYGAGRYYEHVNIHPTLFKEADGLDAYLYKDLYDLWRQHPGGIGHVESIQDCFEHDWNFFKAFREDQRWQLQAFSTLNAGVHPKVVFPEALLTGPLNWEVAKMVFWLRCNGASMDVHENSWEVTKQFYDNIIALKDDDLAYNLMQLLLGGCPGTYQKWPQHVYQEVQQDLQRRYASGVVPLKQTMALAYNCFY